MLLVWTTCRLVPAAQPTKLERESFSQTKAQAEKGDAEAQLRLGALYASGIGVARDLSKAAKWHRKAAEQGLDRAEYQLGQDYAEGFGVKPDRLEASRWYHRAAEQGLAEAQLALGLCYAKGGDDLEINGVEAAKWFRKAAEQSLPSAQFELGRCYLEGTGVTKDTTEGLNWTRLSAERGYAPAQDRLGQCYTKGEGVARDYVQAHKWLNLAAAQDDQRAMDIRVELAKIETLMTPEQITQAQRLARAFKPFTKGAAPGETLPGSSADNQASGETANGNTIDFGNSRTGSVSVKSDQEASEIFVDGAFVGNPPARLQLPEGAHVIEVKKSGFKSYRREVAVSGGAELNLRVALERQ